MSLPINPAVLYAFSAAMNNIKAEKRKVISTTPVGTILQVNSDGLFVIKRSANGDSKGLVEVLDMSGEKYTYYVAAVTAPVKQPPQNTVQALQSLLQLHLGGGKAVLGTNEKQTRKVNPSVSDGSKASYYDLPKEAKTLLDLIQHRDMNHSIGEIFCATYRYGQASHSDKLRDAKKIKFYIEAEIKRLESL